MSTTNFDSMGGKFQLMVMDYEAMDFMEWLENYQDADSDNSEDEIQAEYNDYISFEEELFYRAFWDNGENAIDDMMVDFFDDMLTFTEDLRFYDIEVASGYYSGVQILVTEKSSCDYENTRRWNKKLYREECMIRKWLEKVKEYGWKKLNHIGTFSNGEGLYCYA